MGALGKLAGGLCLCAWALVAATQCQSAHGGDAAERRSPVETRAADFTTETVVFFATPSCPGGWSAFEEARGRVIVGLPTGGTLGGTVGEPLSDRGARTISEVPSHSHSIDAPETTTDPANQGHDIECESGHDDNGGSGGRVQGVDSLNGQSTIPTDERDHDHQFSFGTETTGEEGDEVVDVTMPYMQLLACSPVVEGQLEAPSGAVAYVRGSTCPGGWSEFANAQGRIIVGLGGAVVGGQQGAALGDLDTVSITEVPVHNHEVNPAPASTSGDTLHLHTIDTATSHDSDGGDGDAVQETSTADSTANTSGTGSHSHFLDMPLVQSEAAGAQSVDVNMPYIQLLVCEKN